MDVLIDAPAGLHHVAVADTQLGDVRGDEGFFHYRQYDATQLARQASFEDVWHLLEVGRLPDSDESARFRSDVAARRDVPSELDALVEVVASGRAAPLAALRSVMSAAAEPLSIVPLLDLDPLARLDQARTVAAVVPTILGQIHRHRVGRRSRFDPELDAALDPGPARGHAAAYLRDVTGCEPDPRHVRALEQYLILTLDHGFNASTFTGRVVASTGASLIDVVCAAIGALAGPLHGGAPSRALDALEAIGTPDRAADWVRGEVGAGRRIMGFGHAVYRTVDSRSALLREVAASLGGELVERALAVETEILATLAELKPDRPLPSNVEFYAGVIMAAVGLPPSMFTPTFAVSRTVAWTLHAVEQAAAGKLIRPSARYVGPAPRPADGGDRGDGGDGAGTAASDGARCG